MERAVHGPRVRNLLQSSRLADKCLAYEPGRIAAAGVNIGANVKRFQRLVGSFGTIYAAYTVYASQPPIKYPFESHPLRRTMRFRKGCHLNKSHFSGNSRGNLEIKEARVYKLFPIQSSSYGSWPFCFLQRMKN